MGKKGDFELIISSCDRFSDLWDAHVQLLKESWKDRPERIYLATDRSTEKAYEGIKIISAGEGTEITERMKAVLELVESDYIVFTLDDYFLTEPIYTSNIQRGIDFMENNRVDFLRLVPATKWYLRRENAKPCKGYPGYFIRDISTGNYKITLTPGIWRTDFMRKTVSRKMNAWEYEVALTGMAREFGAVCAISNHNEFPYLDVVRKGKLLRKADRYFKRNPIYHSEREVMKLKDEMALNFRTRLKHVLPKKQLNKLKKAMIRRGHTYYSPTEDN